MAAAQRLICQGSDLVDSGDGLRFELTRGGVPTQAFAVRFQGRVYAYENRCGHMPMELDWVQGKFFDGEGLLLVCSTHGALYEPDSGRCLGGPCANGLVSIDVEEIDGTVYLKG